MELLQQAISYNNQGARLLLESGNSSAAFVMDAIQLIRQALHVLVQEFPELGDGCCANYHTTMSDVSAYSQQQLVSFHCDENLSFLHNNNATLYVHCRPFMITPTDIEITTTRNDLQNRIQMLSAFVVLNLALACHQFGMLSGTNALLQQAKELYHHVVVLMMTQLPPASSCEDNSNKHSVTSETMRCLALNNLAHIHYDQCEYDYSQYCLECMRDIMVQTNCLDITTTTSGSCSILTVWEFEEMILNIMYAKVPSAAQAA